MREIYVDADACPVKSEILRVAERHGLKTYMVSDGGVRPSNSPLVELVIVSPGLDAADDWIAAHIGAGDIAITADTPLAASRRTRACCASTASLSMPNRSARPWPRAT